MKRGGKTFICLLAGIALTMGAKAITGDPTAVQHGESANATGSANSIASTKDAGDSPYGAIVERNIFDLKDPPPPEAPKETNAPPPNVILTGIMTILGQKQALFMVQKQTAPGKPGPAPAPESFIMTEGQRQDGLEVMEIDQKGAKVKIKNDGIVSTITFEVAKAAGPGGQPGPGGQMNPQPHMGRGGFNPNMNNPNAGATPLPTRPIRTPDFSQYSPQGAANPNGAYSPQSGYNPGGVSAVGYNPGAPTQNQQPQMTAEEQAALILANQEVHKNEVAAGAYPPIPPIIPGLPGGAAASGDSLSGQNTGQPANNNNPNLPAWLQPRGTPPPIPR